MDIHPLDGVRLKDGREGTVLDLYEEGVVLMLEICDDKGRTLDMPFVRKEDVSEVTYHHTS